MEAFMDIIPFYEKFLIKLRIPYFLATFLLMIPNFLLHFIMGRVYHVDTLKDFSWFLPLMSGAIYALVVWATHHLRQFTENLYSAFGLPTNDRTLHDIVNRHLRNRTMLEYGVLFGLANTGLGLFYGIWYTQPALYISLIYQIFLVGFIAGLAISGIVAILKAISYLARLHTVRLNLADPDKCGGTAQTGNSLMKFSLGSLLAGSFISFYIYKTPWAHRDWQFVIYAIYAWMGFPHFATLTVLSVPFMHVHNILIRSKYQELARISNQIDSVRAQVLAMPEDQAQADAARLNLLKTRYEMLKNAYTETEATSIWSANLQASAAYTFIYIASSLLPVFEIYKKIRDLIGT
jgi:hypothetical protein